jgi:hypothetical protein
VTHSQFKGKPFHGSFPCTTEESTQGKCTCVTLLMYRYAISLFGWLQNSGQFELVILSQANQRKMIIYFGSLEACTGDALL